MPSPLQRFLPAILLLCIGGQGAWASQARFIVRLADSAAAAEWKAAGRTGELRILEPVIGRHNTRGYISSAVLQAVRARVQALASKSNSTQANGAPMGPATRALADICVVEYDGAVPPEVVVGKLRGRKEFAYVELMPEYQLCSLPNDPLFSIQYHVGLIHANDAWDALKPGGEPVIVGIVDTGIDTSHVDLVANIARNAGEMGLDALGKDKRFNRVDDDNNGFVDDWWGWDFTGADGVSQDNTPLPGNDHGTHVAGIVAATVNNSIGVVGVATHVKVLPVKVGRDAPQSRSVENSGDAIVYAAAVGARVINCSFGSSSQSFADLDVVTAATELGALLVAAAGNDATEQAFYPAAHEPSLCVAATDEDDVRASFSNFHRSVDVCAPGVGIYSTMPNQEYDKQDGTSMASPVVAGVAAMTAYADPMLTPSQLRALVKANTTNIDSLNESFIGLLGSGRVDALAAVTQQQNRIAELVNLTFDDENGDGVIQSGERLVIGTSVHNLLKPLTDCRIEITNENPDVTASIQAGIVAVGPVASDDTAAASSSFEVRIASSAPTNGALTLQAVIYDGTEVVGRQLIANTVNPSYRTINANNIRVTVNASGNIGYNDYAENVQGEGLSWRSGRSLLFEGAFLVGNSPTYLPNVARGSDPSFRDDSFRPYGIVDVRTDSVPDGIRAVAAYSDGNDRYPLGVTVRENVYESTADSLLDAIIITFNISNPADTTISNAYAALFFDWDLGPSGADDGVAWDNDRGIGVVQNTVDGTLPIIGVAMASPLPLNFTAIDNRGAAGIPSIYDHFLRSEKWYMMSSGKLRTNSYITDVSMMIGGGPFDLPPGGTQQVVFVIAAGTSLSSMTESLNREREYAIQLGLNAVPYSPDAATDHIVYCTNGPVFSPGYETTVRVAITNLTSVELSVVDLMGRPVGVPIVADQAGTHEYVLSIPDGANGAYFIVLRTTHGTDALPIQILR